ncbi:MAG: methyltransferase domain-containing protein [Gammaproteobacteria bacterium]
MTEHYVLGSHDEEFERLHLQHQVWSPDTTALWQRAGFGPGQTLLDAGCGPGLATSDLAGLVGPDGRVTGLDEAERFVGAATARSAALGLGNVSIARADLQSVLELTPEYDGVFLRWVLSFLSRPGRAFGQLAAALKPGGALVAMDYCHYEAARVFPRSDTLDQLFHYIARANEQSGGDFDHGAQLATWARREGLIVEWLDPITHAAQPGGRYWYWFTAFCRVFIPQMVNSGHMPAALAEKVVAQLRERETMPGAFFMTPPVMTMIARRPA